MPQMAPINWIILFLLFTVIFLLVSSLTFYLYTPNLNPSKINKINTTSLNWKW